MTRLNQIEKILYLKELIKKEKTGAPKILAQKLHLSERSVYRLIEDLKLLYVGKKNIYYCSERKSYIFKEII